MATTYRLKRKVFGMFSPFAKTTAAFKNAGTAFKAGNIKQGMKSTAAGVGRGLIGTGKIAGGVALGATGMAALAAKPIYDTATQSGSDFGAY